MGCSVVVDRGPLFMSKGLSSSPLAFLRLPPSALFLYGVERGLLWAAPWLREVQSGHCGQRQWRQGGNGQLPPGSCSHILAPSTYRHVTPSCNPVSSLPLYHGLPAPGSRVCVPSVSRSPLVLSSNALEPLLVGKKARPRCMFVSLPWALPVPLASASRDRVCAGGRRGRADAAQGTG